MIQLIARRSRFIKGYTLLVLASLLLTPSLPTPAGIPSIRLDDLLLVCAPFIVFARLSMVYIDLRVAITLWIAISIELGIFSGVVLGFAASFADQFYLLRILKYIGAIVLGSALLAYQEEDGASLRWIAKWLCILSVPLVLLVAQQYFNLFGLNRIYVKFVAPTQYKTLLSGYAFPRPVGMIGNPNELGFLFGLISIVALWLFFREQSKRYRWLAWALVCLLTAASTLSRSSIFATMGAVSVLLVGEFFAGFKFKTSGISMQKNILGLFVVLLGIGIGLAFYLSSNDVFHDEIAWRFTMDYLSQAAATRVSHWHQNLALFQTSPVFGVGSLAHAGDFKYAADNEWLLLLRTGGVVLVLLVIRLFFTRLVRQGVRGEGKRLSLAFALGACIYMIPAAFFFSLVLMPLLLMFWAIAAPAPWKILRKKPRVSVSQVRLMSIEGQPSNGG